MLDIIDEILEALGEQTPGILFRITLGVRRRYPDRQLLVFPDLPLDDYLAYLKGQPDAPQVLMEWTGGLTITEWQNDQTAMGSKSAGSEDSEESPSQRNSEPPDALETSFSSNIQSGHLRICWNEVTFDVFKVEAEVAYRFAETRPYYIFVFDGETDLKGKELCATIYSWQNVQARGVLAYADGVWEQRSDLYDDEGLGLVQETSTVLKLQEDVKSFFQSKELYAQFNIPWKRGLLLIGPPGNGKTRAIKTIIGELSNQSIPCLYVRSMHSPRNYGLEGSEASIKAIFKKARMMTPCLLVLEDLDSLLKTANRAYFLNEVDGFAKNNGILMIATANSLDGLEDAIKNRPSRFDVHHIFASPTYEERHELAKKWLDEIRKMSGPTKFQLSDESLLAQLIARETEHFSYAHMKELFVSFLLKAVRLEEGLSADQSLLLEQLEAIKKQIGTATGDQLQQRRTRFLKLLRVYRHAN